MRKRYWAIVGMLVGVIGLYGASGDAPPKGMPLPEYVEGGALQRPEGYETWMYLGASLGLSYSENASREGPGRFHNVFIQREAFEHYRRTGRFPEKTMLALALHRPRQKESINRHGYFQGELAALELAVKDSEHNQDTWAYYDFGGGDNLRATSTPFPKDRCFDCHRQNAEDDNVFVQFYPVMRRLWAERAKSPGGH